MNPDDIKLASPCAVCYGLPESGCRCANRDAFDHIIRAARIDALIAYLACKEIESLEETAPELMARFHQQATKQLEEES